MDPYHFEKKKLTVMVCSARAKIPTYFYFRIAGARPETAQAIIRNSLTYQSRSVDSLDLNDALQVGDFFHRPLGIAHRGSLWASCRKWICRLGDYNRYYLSKYTISVHELEEHNTLEKFNGFLRELV